MLGHVAVAARLHGAAVLTAQGLRANHGPRNRRCHPAPARIRPSLTIRNAAGRAAGVPGISGSLGPSLERNVLGITSRPLRTLQSASGRFAWRQALLPRAIRAPFAAGSESDRGRGRASMAASALPWRWQEGQPAGLGRHRGRDGGTGRTAGTQA